MIDLGQVLEIARVNLLRQLRDRGDVLFVFLLPTLIILALGVRLGGSGQPVLGVVAPADDAAATALVASLGNDELSVRSVGDEGTLRTQVERGQLDAGIIIPDGFSATLRGPGTAEVRYVGTSDPLASGVRAMVEAAIARADALATAARVATAVGAGTADAAAAAAGAAEGDAPGVAVDVTRVGEPGPFAGFERFTVGATSQLVLFMFLTSLIAATRLVRTRELGVTRRMRAGPTSAGTILVGEAAGRFAIALLQALSIVAITVVVFGVTWGDPLGVGAIIALFGIVSAAGAMLLGATARNADQASALGVFVGLALGALGGCLVPYQIMPPPMQAIARLLPHSWALLGLQTLAGDPNAGVSTIAPDLGVLALFGAVLMVVAIWRFRATLAG